MGTASTMTTATESLGLTLPGFSSIPAVDSRHAQFASLTGQRIVEMVWTDQKPSDILTAKSFDNAVTTVLSMSGSTNAIVHLVAVARRAGIDLTTARFDELARITPVLANLRPAGKYLMEDFFYAGGLRALLVELGELIDGTQMTVSGSTLGENIAGAEIFDTDVIRKRHNPLVERDGLAVLTGNLAPDGAVIKPAAMEQHLLKARGPAVVFKDYADMAARIDSEELDVTAESVIVLQHAGPVGAPGMPEWGQLPIPQKLLKQGVRDMVRISDARMSGTSYGACVLHVAPESFVGGPLALVRDGDMIELDVPGRRLHLEVSDQELAARREAWKPRTRFWRDASASRHAGKQGLRFRFPGRTGGGVVKRQSRRTRDSLTLFKAQLHEPIRYLRQQRRAGTVAPRQHRYAHHAVVQAWPAQRVPPGRRAARQTRAGCTKPRWTRVHAAQYSSA
jgi:dihydroxy-acid dehydratase